MILEGEASVFPKKFMLSYLTKESADIKLKPLLIMPFYMYRDPAAAVDLPQMGHDNFQVTKCPFQTRFYDICSDSVIYTLQNNAQQPQKLAQKGRET